MKKILSTLTHIFKLEKKYSSALFFRFRQGGCILRVILEVTEINCDP